MNNTIRLGTRGSLLALTQSRLIAAQLERLGVKVLIKIIRTTGDRITDRVFLPGDGKGVFVAELEQALLTGDIDLAVHSMKDLPGEMPAGLIIAAVPKREDPRDVFIGRTASTLSSLPSDAVVGTSSLRRRAQLLAARSDLRVIDLRGNIDTRLRKLNEGQYDVICLAAAGLHRLGLAGGITEYLETDVMVPAVGQGALALQTRNTEDGDMQWCLAAIHHEQTSLAVRAERQVLAALGGGCATPLGVLAQVKGSLISMKAAICRTDGSLVIREEMSGHCEPELIGIEMAARLTARALETGIKI